MPKHPRGKEKHMIRYAIYSDYEEAWWNNDCGWCEVFDATLFDKEEFLNLNLPVGGRWVEVHFYM